VAVVPEELTIDQILAEGGERYLPLFQYILKRSNSGITLPGNMDAKMRKLQQMISAKNIFLFQHCQSGWLASSCDIAELIHHYEDRLDWKAFLSRVFEFNVCLPVQYSLQKTFALFKPSIPSFVLQELGSYKPNRFERWVFASLTRDKDGGGVATLVRLLTMPGTTLKLRYLWAMLFPGREYMIWQYPASHPKLMAFYYLYRLKDIFLVGFKTLFHLLLHRA